MSLSYQIILVCDGGFHAYANVHTQNHVRNDRRLLHTPNKAQNRPVSFLIEKLGTDTLYSFSWLLGHLGSHVSSCF